MQAIALCLKNIPENKKFNIFSDTLSGCHCLAPLLNVTQRESELDRADGLNL